MGLRDLIKKKDGLREGNAAYAETLNKLTGSEFTFIRSDTNTHEIIYPPNHPTNDRFLSAREPAATPSKSRHSLDIFHGRSRGNSLLSGSGDPDGDNNHKIHRRLSHRLGLSRAPKTSEFVPENLPQINVTSTPDDPTSEDNKGAQHLWEKRATILATTNEERQRSRSRSVTALPSPSPSPSSTNLAGTDTALREGTGAVISSQKIDRDIQEAIRLHEEGDLERSTQLFGCLADPCGANNPLSQVLYGLALRLVTCGLRKLKRDNTSTPISQDEKCLARS
jgi:hypothetical protein